jgi:transposase-like protein
MAEILVMGMMPEDQKHVVVCGYCRSKIRYKESEGTVKESQRDGKKIRFECPLCHRDITVDYNRSLERSTRPSAIEYYNKL